MTAPRAKPLTLQSKNPLPTGRRPDMPVHLIIHQQTVKIQSHHQTHNPRRFLPAICMERCAAVNLRQQQYGREDRVWLQCQWRSNLGHGKVAGWHERQAAAGGVRCVDRSWCPVDGAPRTQWMPDQKGLLGFNVRIIMFKIISL